MRILSLLVLLATSAAVHAAPTRNNSGGNNNNQPSPPATPSGGAAAAINPALVPDFGVTRNTNPGAKQKGSCDGSNGSNVVLIPCSCPPDREAFLQKLSETVAQGNSFGDKISFSNDAADQSQATNKLRATAMLIVLQNFNGAKGAGCPGASAPNFISQQKTGVRAGR